MICTFPPCGEVGPFHYCPIKGCTWAEEITKETITVEIEACSTTIKHPQHMWQVVGSYDDSPIEKHRLRMCKGI